MNKYRFGNLSRISGVWIATLTLILFISIAASAQTDKVQSAVIAGREATAKNPESAEAWLQLGRALFEKEDFDEAEKALVKIKPLTDDHVILMETSRLLGTIYLENQGDLDKALDCFQWEITHAREIPNRADEAYAHYNLGRVLRRMRRNGDPDDARKEFNEALKLATRDSEKVLFQTALANELFETGNTKDALGVMQVMDEEAKASKDANLKALAFLGCGRIYTNIGEVKRKSNVQTEKSEAAKYFIAANKSLLDVFVVLRAAKVDDRYTEAIGYQVFGRLVETQGNFQAAIGRYRQALDKANQGHHTDLVNDLNARITALSHTPNQEYVFGAIDIGSKGIKAVLVSTITSDGKEKGPDGKPKSLTTELYRRTINTDLNDSRTDNNGNFSAAAIKKTAVAVHDLIDEMMRARKGSTEKPFKINSIFVAGSSSLAQAPNRPELTQQIFDETQKEAGAPANRPGATPDTATPFITSSEELIYAIIGSIKPEDRENSSLVDIGSGNGRWGYIHSDTDGRTPVSLDIRLGSVTLAAAAMKDKQESEDFTIALEREADQQIGAPLRRQMKASTGFSKRKRVYIIGGAAYALATLMHPEAAKSDEVELTRKDLLDFYDRVKAGSVAKPYRPDISQIGDADTTEVAKKQIDNVLLEVFKPREQQLSAAILLKTLAVNALDPKQTFIFPRFGGWALGMAEYKYFVDQAKVQADKLKPAGDTK